MASSSSSSFTSVPTHYEYDVFLCFNHRYFTADLYEALHRAGIRTFKNDDDDYGTREGEDLNPEIERSITTSRASIVVLSQMFANSIQCLDELCLILEQRRDGSHLVLPVFYKVDPSDIRNQRGSFMIEEVGGTIWTEDNVTRWNGALTEVADLNGMVNSDYRDEAIFILKIVEKLCSLLGVKPDSTLPGLIGIETRAERIISWLNNEKLDSPVLAICGMGGSGKTALAKHVYYSNLHKFEGCSFLEDIEMQPDGLLGVQKQLLRDISGDNNMTISNVYEGALQLEMVIRKRKVLIVVDDIDDRETLGKLFGTKVFPTQSKIIITTRHLEIHRFHKFINREFHVIKVQLLDDLESLELLCFHAFGSRFPIDGFEELAFQLAHYCEGNPLALKVLGSSLSGQGAREDMIIWRSKIDSLNSLKRYYCYNIQHVLINSFESLPSDENKELFLHIACLFIGNRLYDVQTILEDDYHAKSGIVTLINRCFLTHPRDCGGKLAMHGLLQEMARAIVSSRSQDYPNPSRVWRDYESYHLLRKAFGSDKIEGLLVDMQAAEQWMASEAFKTSVLVKMQNLKFLQHIYVELTGSYENFPDLRWLRWHRCYLKTIPPSLLTSCLVALYMNFGDLEEFDPHMVLNSLKILDLQSSPKLVSICNLHRLPKLETLILDHCTSLTHVCKTIGYLENLSFLSLKGCTALWKASSNQMFVNQPERLKALCSTGGIPELPLCSLPQSLFELSLSGNPFQIWPNNIDLKFIRTLNLTSCSHLKSLPCLPSMLEELYVDWCRSLEIITFQSTCFPLRLFNYQGCYKLCEIQGLFKLVSIEKLDEADLEYMRWIKVYQYHKVDLVGDEITKGRLWNIQMLYEYGIRSTYLQGIKDQSMATHEYMSASHFLSFRVPLHSNKRRIRGLYVTFLYKSLSGGDRNIWPLLFARISNMSKGVIWVYNPVVFCKPKDDNDVVWLSYWPIGNTLDAGDEVHVDILVGDGTIRTSGCGASLVYVDAGEVDKEEKSEEEVIGGDLSQFKVTKGGYYLCRCDFFKSRIPASLFGDNIQITDSRRWRMRIPGPSVDEFAFDREVNAFRNPYRHEIQTDAFKFLLEDMKLQLQNLDHLKIALKGIESATENFDEKYCIGSGGYGKVYKCELPETTNSTVAIKRVFCRQDSQVIKGFLSEINVLSRCEHPNIIPLLGFCVEDNEMLLVYEHASNGSLDDYLGSTDNITNLSWAQCLKMCIDIARGLSYLHTTMDDKITTMHHSIKSTNIMLGKNWEAKITDYWFSKFNSVNHKVRTIKTIVYLDPQYAKTGRFEKASDIYSLGVILFEIFSGKLAYDKTYIEENEKGLAPIAQRHFKMGAVKEMLSPKIKGDTSDLGLALSFKPDQDSVDTFSRIANQCLAESQAERPTIQVVIEELINALYFQVQHLERLKIPLKDILSGTNDFNQNCCIGSGGYGEVYKAELRMKIRYELPETSNTVAIKRIMNREDNQGREGFLFEINALSKCKHPNIIPLLGYCVEGNEMLLVYEYASNGSLDSYLGSTEKMINLTWAQRLKICIGIAHGLNYLHTTMEEKNGIVHCDIKSDNILLDKNWEAKIADFGLSKFHPGNQHASTINTKRVVGTQVYLDPEYARTGRLKKASDIYSFGVVLFEIFSGTLAYDRCYTWEHEKGLAPIVRRRFKNRTIKEMLDSNIMDEASELGFTVKVQPDRDSC